MTKSKTIVKYGCNEYRQEMILVGLQKRLADPGISQEERKALIEEIAQIEKKMGID